PGRHSGHHPGSGLHAQDLSRVFRRISRYRIAGTRGRTLKLAASILALAAMSFADTAATRAKTAVGNPTGSVKAATAPAGPSESATLGPPGAPSQGALTPANGKYVTRPSPHLQKELEDFVKRAGLGGRVGISVYS